MVQTKVAQDGNACKIFEDGTCTWDTESGSSETSENPIKREQWKRKIDFFIACMGFSIGLGNVWRFPYLCYKNGGGVFLVPYFISVFLIGIPIFLLEVTLGQLMSRGVIAAWDICPLFRGLGFASSLINFMVNTYYTVILAWAFHYLFSSFTSTLPWTGCNHSWNTGNCKTGSEANTTATAILPNISAALHTRSKSEHVLASDPVTEYWENRVLGMSPGIGHVGTIRWELALCLLLAWLLIFACICKGIKTSGKVMYFTATSPYLFMIILLIRTSLLDGALDGLKFYLRPDWSKLGDMTVWSDAGAQIFFSYALGLGALTALGSYNTFHHNSIRDCFLFALVNTMTSLLAGCVIFATLGYMSHLSKIPIKLVAESGPGLAFLIYPKALGTMPGSPFWSVCFFIMIILLGIDSMFGGVEGFVAAVADFVPQIHCSTRLRCSVVGLACGTSFFIGLTMVTNGGMYVFQLFDYYCGSRIILLVGFLESVVIGYIYGARRFGQNMKLMYGMSLGFLPLLFWCILTPIFTMSIFVLSAIVYEELTYRRASQLDPYIFPGWAVKLGWAMAGSSIILIPIVMLVQICRTPGTLLQRLSYLIEPQLPVGVSQKLTGKPSSELPVEQTSQIPSSPNSPQANLSASTTSVRTVF